MITRKLNLYFPRSEAEKPIVYHLVKDYDLVINIFRAKVTPQEEGYLIIDVTGTEENINGALEYLKQFNVEINTQNKGFRWEETRCTSCGCCLTHCPTGALYIADEKTRRVAFDTEKCVECFSCIENCPFGACRSVF
jgi:ferredoxin